MQHPADTTLSFPSTLTLLEAEFSSPCEQPTLGCFEENRSFARSVLGNWGLTFGELSFSPDNQATLRCILEMVEQRQRDAHFRIRAKDELNMLQFDRDRCRSYLEQSQRTIEDHSKRIGRLQNENTDLRGKMRKLEAAGKRQREEDRKMIAMLRAKNEQILHEIKKKENEINRIKEQLKKNTDNKTTHKNCFEIYHNFPQRPNSKETQHVDKFAFLFERNERDLAVAMKQNTQLRQRLCQIRESLLQFNRWIDQQVFGEETEESPQYQACQGKFYPNHLLLTKDNLTDQLNRLLDLTKQGIIQLREICRGNQTPPKITTETVQFAAEINFKKKTSLREIEKAVKPETARLRQSKTNKMTITKKIDPASNSQNQTPRSSHELQARQMRTEPNAKHLRHHKSSMTEIKKAAALLSTKNKKPSMIEQKNNHVVEESPTIEAPFEDELSDVASNDSSIISHISIDQMGKGHLEKWDQLYHEDAE